MKITQLTKIEGGQDGAIFDGRLFRFQADGRCFVYSLPQLLSRAPSPAPLGAFRLDRAELLCPHCNSAAFGPKPEGETFPLLYVNVYNTYAKCADRREGTCLVYRLKETDGVFSSQLIQIIEVGFAKAAGLWRSETVEDIRPYGNFAADTDSGMLYAFTMRDETRRTRFFSFRLPSPDAGLPDAMPGVRRVCLTQSDLCAQFDVPYMHFMQGACLHKGKLYSVEGFTSDRDNPPALRIISLSRQEQTDFVLFSDHGFEIEAEMIDFSGDVCVYSDYAGNVFQIEF